MFGLSDKPAFPMSSGPEPRVDETTHYNEGMSVREYAAIELMVGMMGDAEWRVHPDEAAQWAVKAADAIVGALCIGPADRAGKDRKERR